MKKFLLILLSIVIVASFCVAGCAPQGSGGGSGAQNPNGNAEGTVGGEASENAFTVSLVYDGEVYIPKIEMSALWTAADGSSISDPVKFNYKGRASITGLDGDYKVTLTNVPSGFTYNPNIYTVNNEKRSTVIELYKLVNYIGNGTDLYKDIINLKQLGAYRITFTEPGQHVFCQYSPNKNGMYAIESIMDIAANEINPRLDVYVGTFAWKPEAPSYRIDGGGASSIYTKNFRYEVNITEAERGNVYAFAVKFDSSVGVPVNIDFTITRDGDFDSEEQRYDMVEVDASVLDAEGRLPVAERPAGRYRRAYTSSGSYKVLDGTRYGFCADDGYYHLKNDDGTLSDKVLYASINDSTLDIVDFQNDMVGMQYKDKDYTFIIRGAAGLRQAGYGSAYVSQFKDKPSYYDCLNSDGRYPVTRQLKDFLMAFSNGNYYFFDGMGWAEELGYQSNDADQWLFACGYYE